uniref:Selenide, water dikinase n=1 Tax=Rhodosorus marinus TaxID=101924 RepID=A0A7S0G1E4_9RHOD|mmetsp:Transcript_19577/g.28471  ORF Transcript_19577/g.28471 Transcript_19577/m.28471 type:complete len:308 (+) Transcript_19577:364-1287(+)
MMDTSVIEIRRLPNYQLVSTTDFFFPLVDDPFLMGRIACANVLSDMYSEGVTEVDNLLMILAASIDMPPNCRDIVTWKMIEGFRSLAEEAGSSVTGGQSIYNPWPIIGGTAMSVVPKERVLMPTGAIEGDVLVLTKPLGTQVAVNAFQWINIDERWSRISDVVSREQLERAFDISAMSMERLNRKAAELMWKHGAHAATDVTGFGILGHAEALARNQSESVSFVIHTLPVIRAMAGVDAKLQNLFRLVKGRSAETSGGLLICLPKENVGAFCSEIYEAEGWPAIVVGTVEGGDRSASIAADVEIKEL